ncbi:MAG: hypothetical protein ACR2QJ_11705 [Geminicoccaceae bacterium]
MTAMMPYAFADLTEQKPAGSRDNADPKGRTTKVASSGKRSHAMPFKAFGPDPKENVEPELLYTAEDLERAAEDARRTTALEVEAELRSALADDIEQHRCDMLAAIKKQLDQHRSGFEEEIARLAQVSQRLGISLAQAIIPRAIAQCPLIDISEHLQITMARLTAEPSMELRLPPDLVEDGAAMLAELAKDVGFKGEITAIADPALGPGDASLRWGGGAVDRRLDRLEAEALDLVGRWMNEAPSPDMPSEPDGLQAPGGATDQIDETTSASERATP